MPRRHVPCLMVGAPSSGGGKTTLTLSLLSALTKRGLRVGAIKTGPDYIDPAFHSALLGRPALNIDSWCMGQTLQNVILSEASKDVDIVIIESAMGVFDGLLSPEGARGAPSDIAQRYGIPVLLILNMAGRGQSVGPIALGFCQWSPQVHINAVVLNQLASPRHKKLGQWAIEKAHMKCLGMMMRQKKDVLPERHLGLVQAREYKEGFAVWFEQLAAKTEEEVDIQGILDYAAPLQWPRASLSDTLFNVPKPLGQKIALAWDDAFSFLYGHLHLLWQRMGVEFVPFSPLKDEAPDRHCDVCLLPGGYPELHGARLAQCRHFKQGLRDFAKTRPVYGECGGYAVLGEAIEDGQGTWHEMVGLLHHRTSFKRRKLHLGYRQARLLHKSFLGERGDLFRGHEFHYMTTLPSSFGIKDAPLFHCENGYGHDLGDVGSVYGHVFGSFFHILSQKKVM